MIRVVGLGVAAACVVGGVLALVLPLKPDINAAMGWGIAAAVFCLLSFVLSDTSGRTDRR